MTATDTPELTVTAMTHPLTPPARVAFLHALADHFDTHPALADVIVHRPDHTGRTRLQVSVRPSAQELPALLAWADSIAASTATISRYGDDDASRVHVHIAGEIAGHLVDVWDAVPALDASTLEDGDEPAVGDLIKLAAFAAAHVARQQLLAGAR